MIGKNSDANVLIRLMVGSVFLAEGIQKFLFNDALGAGRFMKIGIPFPGVMSPFVGVVEIVFGTMILTGLLTRLSTIPLIINILVAIATTKLPMLERNGFWAMVHEARTDWSMLLGLVFLVFAGPGKWSLDYLISSRKSFHVKSTF
jgi:putative oxidoreductase